MLDGKPEGPSGVGSASKNDTGYSGNGSHAANTGWNQNTGSLDGVCERHHPGCFACGQSNACGLGVAFHPIGEGAVEASFSCRSVFAGYPGMLHGGIICTLLDSAMTTCLFAQGVEAVTVDLKIRFRHAVALEYPAVARAWFDTGGSVLYRLSAELLQDGRVMARANGRFVEKHGMACFAKG